VSAFHGPCDLPVEKMRTLSERKFRSCTGILSLVLALAACDLLEVPAAATFQSGATNALALKDFVQLVLQRNETIQIRILELAITKKRLRAEQGVFEPELVASYDRVENKRQNTAEQRRSTGVVEFEEDNNIYNGGLEALIPTGARIRLGYTLRDLRNNLQEPPVGSIVTNTPRGEYQTFIGLSVTQPLLKNAWLPATLANIRLAAVASEIAFQEYRRQMMIIISTAEAAYWNLYMAQEQVRFFRDSVGLAESLVADNRERLNAGRGSELEVLEAEAGRALRKSKLAEAEQKYFETTAQLLGFLSESASLNTWIRATEEPAASQEPFSFSESGMRAFEMNPDYLTQLKRIKQEDIRVMYARNQRLPQLDFRGSFGMNGLGSNPGESWEEVGSQDWPSFSAGLELRIPLGGGMKTRNELHASKLAKQQALVALNDLETQILNAIENSIRKINNARGSIGNYQTVVNFNRNLLESERGRLEVGRVESRRVLEADASLFEARNSELEARVQAQRAQLELELVQGSLLKDRNFDVSQRVLQQKLEDVFHKVGIAPEHYQDLLKDLELEYMKEMTPPEGPEAQKSRQLLRKTLFEMEHGPKAKKPNGEK
jgi:outer membrane protein